MQRHRDQMFLDSLKRSLLFFNLNLSTYLYLFIFYLLAIPVTFKQKLKNQQVEEGHNITLQCEISKAGVPVEWRLGGEQLENGDKYQIKQRDSILELTIRDAVPEDSGIYTCVCREQKTKATVKVIGMVF